MILGVKIGIARGGSDGTVQSTHTPKGTGAEVGSQGARRGNAIAATTEHRGTRNTTAVSTTARTKKTGREQGTDQVTGTKGTARDLGLPPAHGLGNEIEKPAAALGPLFT